MPNKQNSLSDYDTTEKVERTDTGFRLAVESKRGTDTRDQDVVEAELRTETKPTSEEMRSVTAAVCARMNELRQFQPDSEDNDE